MKLTAFTTIILLMTTFLLPTFAQPTNDYVLTIESIQDSQFPTLQAEITVKDASGEPVPELTLKDFAAQEDGAPVEITAVRPSDLGIAVVLVVDTSDSMFALPAALTAANAFVDALRPADEIALIDFDTNVALVQPLTTNHAQVKTALEEVLEQGGQTALYDGVLAGVREAAKSSLGRRVVVVLADGNESGVSISGRSGALDEATTLGIPVYTIGLGASADRAYLENIAALTGGQYLDAPNSNQLLELYTALAERLRQAYLLTLVSAVPGDGTVHELSLEVIGGGASAQQSHAFQAALIPPEITLAPLENETLTGTLDLTPQINVQGTRYEVKWSLDGEAVRDQPTVPPYTYTLAADSLPPGVHNVSVQITDAAGLSASASLDFEIALRSPTVTLSGLPTNHQLDDSPVTVQLAIDSQLAISRVTFQIDDNPPQTFDTAPFAYEIDPLAIGAAGEHVLTVTVEDESGATYPQSVTFTTAISPPLITFRGAPENPAREPFTLQAELESERPADLTWLLNGEVVTPRLVEGVYSLEIDPVEKEPGTYTLSLSAEDNRGVAAQPIEAAFEIAALPPLVKIIGLPDLIVGETQVALEVTSQTPISSVSYSLDDGEAQVAEIAPYTFDIDPPSLGAGAHTLSVTVTNTGGETFSQSIAFAVDPDAIPAPTSVPAVVVPAKADKSQSVSPLLVVLVLGGVILAVVVGLRLGRAGKKPHIPGAGKVALTYEDTLTGKPLTYKIKSERTTLGRASSNDIVLLDAENKISRDHAAIVARGNTWVVEDLKSRHGVSVNGERIEGSRVIGDGDRLQLGSVELRFAAPGFTVRAEDLLATRVDNLPPELQEDMPSPKKRVTMLKEDRTEAASAAEPIKRTTRLKEAKPAEDTTQFSADTSPLDDEQRATLRGEEDEPSEE